MQRSTLTKRKTRNNYKIGDIPLSDVEKERGYVGRLQKLEITTLLEHRMLGDLIETFKIVNGHNMFDHSSAYHTHNLRVTSHLLTRAPSDTRTNCHPLLNMYQV